MEALCLSVHVYFGDLPSNGSGVNKRDKRVHVCNYENCLEQNSPLKRWSPRKAARKEDHLHNHTKERTYIRERHVKTWNAPEILTNRASLMGGTTSRAVYHNRTGHSTFD